MHLIWATTYLAAADASPIVLATVPLVVAIIAAAGAFFAARAGNKKTQAGLQEVHVLVNSQLTRVLARVDQLEGLLSEAGVAIPPSTSDLQKRIEELESELMKKSATKTWPPEEA